ncbi:MAG: phosphatase PAP2 family protein [Acidimicrobiales bacterium]
MTPFVADFRRHASDAVRVVLAAVVLTLASVPVSRRHLPILERDAFRFFNDLPSFLFPVIWPVMQLGSAAAVPVVAGLALVFRRRRMAIDLALSGTAAFVIARLVKDWVQRGRPAAFLDDVFVRGGAASGLGFISGHSAVAAALATAAAPWLGRRGRRLAWGLVFVVMVSRVYTGAHLPLDVIGGAAMGWGIGALMHLAVGAPVARLTPEITRRVLTSLGLAVDGVCQVQDSGRHALVQTPDTERLYATVVSRDHRDTDLVHRSWRRLVSRWVRERGRFVPPRERVHRHAALSLLARNRGIRTPEVLGVGTFGNGAGVVVERYVEGRRLAHLTQAEAVAVLPNVWAQVGALHGAGITHGDLGAANVLIDGRGQPWLLDFTDGLVAADPTRYARDVADLLADLTDLVGAEVAVRSATEALGSPAIGPLRGLLAHPYWSGESKEVRRVRTELLGALSTQSGSS